MQKQESKLPVSFSRSRNVSVQRPLAAYHAKGSLVCSQEIPYGIIPRQFCLHSSAPEFAHPLPLLGMVEKPKNFGREVGNLVRVIAIKRCFLRTNPTFFQ